MVNRLIIYRSWKIPDIYRNHWLLRQTLNTRKRWHRHIWHLTRNHIWILQGIPYPLRVLLDTHIWLYSICLSNQILSLRVDWAAGTYLFLILSHLTALCIIKYYVGASLSLSEIHKLVNIRHRSLFAWIKYPRAIYSRFLSLRIPLFIGIGRTVFIGRVLLTFDGTVLIRAWNQDHREVFRVIIGLWSISELVLVDGSHIHIGWIWYAPRITVEIACSAGWKVLAHWSLLFY